VPRLESTLDEIRAHGGRVTPARRAVLAAILDAGEHHFTAADVLAAVDKTHPQPDRATVYRTLELLTAIGILKPLQLNGEAIVFHRTDHRHGHVVCRVCGVITEVPEPALTDFARTLRDQTHFTIDADCVAVSGTCERCTDTARSTATSTAERTTRTGE
jgi:Fur family ferric uptake transcriptional regulator